MSDAPSRDEDGHIPPTPDNTAGTVSETRLVIDIEDRMMQEGVAVDIVSVAASESPFSPAC